MVEKSSGLPKPFLNVVDNVVERPYTVQRLVERGKLAPGSTLEDLQHMHVPADVAADALRFNQGFRMPEQLEPILSWLDSITNLTKGGQTVLFSFTLYLVPTNK